jgi:hypothetical protein
MPTGQENASQEEVIDIFTQWSKRAILSCLRSENFELGLDQNQTFNSSLEDCLENMVREMLTIYSKRFDGLQTSN